MIVGEKAPDFELIDQDGKTFKLSYNIHNFIVGNSEKHQMKYTVLKIDIVDFDLTKYGYLT